MDLRRFQIVRETPKTLTSKDICENSIWLQRKTGGMEITLKMSRKAKWVIRSQAPTSAMIGYGEGSETKC